ncbi:hypothetical protein FA15DRAFT_556490, partial [Coprinopsis marcescibilis]
TPQDLVSLIIEDDKIYHHKILCIHYTIYNMQCKTDSINACNHPDIMLWLRDDKAHLHPYWYTCVIGYF